ncbi:hypothetical protein OBBRIDRAFT_799483, partial [Obba rivulosa]
LTWYVTALNFKEMWLPDANGEIRRIVRHERMIPECECCENWKTKKLIESHPGSGGPAMRVFQGIWAVEAQNLSVRGG